jgi:hypothetical protein
VTQAHARRRAGGDHVAGLQGHEAAQIGHDMRDSEDLRARVAILAPHAIDLQPQVHVLRVRQFVGGHQPRAQGRIAV